MPAPLPITGRGASCRTSLSLSRTVGLALLVQSIDGEAASADQPVEEDRSDYLRATCVQLSCQKGDGLFDLRVSPRLSVWPVAIVLADPD